MECRSLPGAPACLFPWLQLCAGDSGVQAQALAPPEAQALGCFLAYLKESRKSHASFLAREPQAE